MFQRAGDAKSTYIDHTSVKQLLKCYGGAAGKQRDGRRAARSNHKARQHSSPSQHLEKRPRPRTCTACRVCINEGKKESAPRSAVTDLLPHRQLAGHSGETGKHKHETQQKPMLPGKASKCTELTSCRSAGGFGEQDSRSSTSHCSSSLYCRTAAEPWGNKSFKVPVFPAKNPLDLCLVGLNPTDIDQSDVFSDEELRKWIIQFGGDEQAAFMARGLQRLQLAYEQGKAEMSQWAREKTSLPAAR